MLSSSLFDNLNQSDQISFLDYKILIYLKIGLKNALSQLHCNKNFGNLDVIFVLIRFEFFSPNLKKPMHHNDV